MINAMDQVLKAEGGKQEFIPIFQNFSISVFSISAF
jgi:hypothetical protein